MVQRRLKKAALLNITYKPEEDVTTVGESPVSPESTPVQPIQSDTAQQQRLPYKEEEE